MNPIGYVDTTWSPIAMRCTPVGPACDRCWHLSMANRLAGNRRIPLDQRAAYAGDGPPVLTERLEDPLHWRKPRRAAVQFMGDLFHEAVPDEFIASIFNEMACATRHTFLLLTKRPKRALKLMSRVKPWEGWMALDGKPIKGYGGKCVNFGDAKCWPLPNVHLGVSVWDQPSADRNIPILLQIPAAKRWVSYEPALRGVEFRKIPHPLKHTKCEFPVYLDSLAVIDWIVVGRETGPGARPAKAEWFLKVIEDCRAAGVPVWVKKAPEGVPDVKELPR